MGKADRLENALEAGKAAWPDVCLAEPTFRAHLTTLFPDGDASGAHFSDLYLACACAQQDRTAISHFERSYLSKVPAFLSRLNVEAAFVDEVRQVLREKLLVRGEDDGRPKIESYQGRGPLEGWLRIVAVNTALRMLRKDQRIETRADITPEGTPPDPELDFIKLRHKEDFEAALRDAFKGLTPRDRNLLRLFFVDGLNIDAIGAAYGVHRATAARWIASVREKMLEDVRRILRERLKITASEFDSLANLLNSRLEMTLRSVLTD